MAGEAHVPDEDLSGFQSAIVTVFDAIASDVASQIAILTVLREASFPVIWLSEHLSLVEFLQAAVEKIVERAMIAILGKYLAGLTGAFKIRLARQLSEAEARAIHDAVEAWMNDPARLPEIVAPRWRQSEESRNHPRKRKPSDRHLNPAEDPATMDVSTL